MIVGGGGVLARPALPGGQGGGVMDVGWQGGPGIGEGVGESSSGAEWGGVRVAGMRGGVPRQLGRGRRRPQAPRIRQPRWHGGRTPSCSRRLLLVVLGLLGLQGSGRGEGYWMGGVEP